MHQPFLNTATAQLNFMSTDQLREIFEDDDKLDEKIDEIVRRNFFVFFKILINILNSS